MKRNVHKKSSGCKGRRKIRPAKKKKKVGEGFLICWETSAKEPEETIFVAICCSDSLHLRWRNSNRKCRKMMFSFSFFLLFLDDVFKCKDQHWKFQKSVLTRLCPHPFLLPNSSTRNKLHLPLAPEEGIAKWYGSLAESTASLSFTLLLSLSYLWRSKWHAGFPFVNTGMIQREIFILIGMSK